MSVAAASYPYIAARPTSHQTQRPATQLGGDGTTNKGEVVAFASRFADKNDTTTWTTSGRVSAVYAVVEEEEARLKALNEKKQAGFSLEQPTRTARRLSSRIRRKEN